MAAFVDGTLPRGEVAAVAAHLAGCRDCREVVAETARFEREEQSRLRPRVSKWWAAAAAIFVAAVVAISLLRPRTPMEHLIAAAPREHRTVGARLSGFPWARLAAPQRGVAAADPADLKLNGAAGDVLEKSKEAHATGVAYLLTKQRSEAVATLERAANQSNDPRVWSDLAAARYAVAMEDDHLALLPEALADADHSLRLNPKLPEALFNRALIIEAMGLRDQARKAWQKYLEVDPSSGWAVEGREHLKKLEQQGRMFDRKFLDQMPPEQLVREFPQEARTGGEWLLAKWADAPDQAKLARIRAIGNVLATFNGEYTLADSVAAIDHADERARSALMEAHRLYRDAQTAPSAEQERQFRQAADLFAQANSPMAGVALYRAAIAMVFQDRGAAARDELRSLLGRFDRSRYPALEANVRWELAIVANIAGDWGTAVREASAAEKTLAALHEESKSAEVGLMAAHALEQIGNLDPAWRQLALAFPRFDSDAQRFRRASFLYGAACVLRSIDHNDAAVAMLGLMIDDCGNSSPRLRTLAYADRARLLAGDAAAAVRELGEAGRSASRISDPAMRELANVQIDLVSASLRVAHEPLAAAAEADRAVTYFSDHHLGGFLPDALLQRARARRAAGDHRAAGDYALALAEIERQDATIEDASAKETFFDVASRVRDDAIDFHLSRGDATAAFAVADRAKRGTAATEFAGDFSVLEYAVLPHALAIFCIENGRLTAEKIAVERTDLDTQIATFIEKIEHRQPSENEGAALYRLLIEPLRERLARAAEIVIIPDRRLNSVPFAALYDAARGRYLCQDFAIRLARNTAPQAAELGPLSPALVVADPSAPNMARLFASGDEAVQIAALHGTTAISGAAATRARFIAEAQKAALIHYSGHANSDAAESFAALLLASDGGDNGVLGSADIARLSLPRHPLVVLAACGTFRGDPTHIAGMSSIARAFLDAGARAVAGTLWEIDDDVAAVFFRRFHEQLRAGAAPARALREAQLDMLSSADPRLRQPATWAPVELLSGI